MGQSPSPPEMRKTANLNPGDSLDLHLYKGTIVLRKNEPLTDEQCASLLERSRSQEPPTVADEEEIQAVVREVRAERR